MIDLGANIRNDQELEIAAVSDFDFDINRLVGAGMRDGGAQFIFFFGDLGEVVHEIFRSQ